MRKINTKYLNKVYETKKFKATVDKVVKEIRKIHKKTKINAIAFTGSSGAALAYPVSYITGIPLLCVRKSTKDNHYHNKLEGYVNPKNYVIIDDIIATGRTVKSIRKAIAKESPKSKLLNVVLYNQLGAGGFNKYFDANIICTPC